MRGVLKSCGFLLIFLGLLWFGHFGITNTEETPAFALEPIPFPTEVAPTAASLVWAGVCAVVVGGVMVIGGFWLIGHIKSAQLRAQALSNRRFPRF